MRSRTTGPLNTTTTFPILKGISIVKFAIIPMTVRITRLTVIVNTNKWSTMIIIIIDNDLLGYYTSKGELLFILLVYKVWISLFDSYILADFCNISSVLTFNFCKEETYNKSSTTSTTGTFTWMSISTCSSN